ncbi:menin [Eurytemora carolleeae]|uniref:menin n=1 Tax=Eurytemora carolleeae TaxID=1294199 RepID=UPI000C7644E8|nr:menin [Eurytemora carolleeae]|eukprot:XP_023324624.1 menin-like [Eurytemora affinis]
MSDLAMSEDHAWVVYGPEGHQTVEVFIYREEDDSKECIVLLTFAPTPHCLGMEVAAVVSAMSPAISPTLDSLERKPFHWTYSGNLGDLEEGSPTHGRPNPAQLYHQGVLVNQKEYNNRHVYPYMYSAGYNYRAGDFNLALQDWAGAAAVLKGYRHGKDDEEIYKEFMEINNELIPHLLKTQGSLLLDSTCFSNLLQFYDGLCSWEENSSTPVLHIGWVKPMVKCISQFSASVRANIEISTLEGIEESTDPNGSGEGKIWDEYIMENNNYKTSFDCLSPEPESLYQQEPETDFLTMNQDTLARYALECKEEKSERDISSLVSNCGEQILDIGLLVGNQTPCPKHINSYLFTELEKIEGKSKKSGKDGKSKSGKVHTRLYSAKMSGLKDLLQSERLNSSALHLQLTAQSQGETRRKGDGESTGGRIKRVRRD